MGQAPGGRGAPRRLSLAPSTGHTARGGKRDVGGRDRATSMSSSDRVIYSIGGSLACAFSQDDRACPAPAAVPISAPLCDLAKHQDTVSLELRVSTSSVRSGS